MTDLVISNSILREVADQTGKLFNIIKFVGTDDSTEFMANDEDKTLFLQGKFKKPIEQLRGEFGIPDIALFNGLLRFPSYNADGAKISVTRETKVYNNKPIDETVTEFKFRDKNGKGANFRTMAAQHLDELSVSIPVIPWDVSFTPEKSKISEFAELAKLCSGLGNNFGVSLVDSDLVFSFGDDTDSTHNATMSFNTDVSGTLKKIEYPTAKFLDLLKIVGNLPTELKFTNRRIVGVFAESENVVYKYFLRGSV